MSKSSFHRWRAPGFKERLIEMVHGSGGGGLASIAGSRSVGGGGDVVSAVDGSGGISVGGEVLQGVVGGQHQQQGLPSIHSLFYPNRAAKKRDLNDRLAKIKAELQTFCQLNAEKDPSEQIAISSSFIQAKSREIRDELLNKNETEEGKGCLTEEEVTAFKAFKGSKSWACQIGNHLGVLTVQWTEAAKANVLNYLKHTSGAPRQKKNRAEFTAQEKVDILEEIDRINAENKAARKPQMSVDEICEKWGTSKSSLHRWRQQYKEQSLQHVIRFPSSNGGRGGSSKRIFKDRLQIIKESLDDFVKSQGMNESDINRAPVVYHVLQQQALIRRDEILAEIDRGTMSMKEDEVQALRNFKASTSWLREVARKFGWKMEAVDINDPNHPDHPDYDRQAEDAELLVRKYELDRHQQELAQQQAQQEQYYEAEGAVNHHGEEYEEAAAAGDANAVAMMDHNAAVAEAVVDHVGVDMGHQDVNHYAHPPPQGAEDMNMEPTPVDNFGAAYHQDGHYPELARDV